MQPKEAISRAKDIVRDMFSDDRPYDIALEEIELDRDAGQWKITIGFERSLSFSSRQTETLVAAGISPPLRGRDGRLYKVVTLADQDGDLVSIKNRELAYQ